MMVSRYCDDNVDVVYDNLLIIEYGFIFITHFSVVNHLHNKKNK